MKGDFVVYILRNTQKKRYIGMTNNLSRRLTQHNKGFSRFTKSRGPWEVEWQSKTLNHTEALKLEKLLKKQKGGEGLIRVMKTAKLGS